MKRPYRQILIVLPDEIISKIDTNAMAQDLDRSLMIGQILEKYYIDKEIHEYYKKAQDECFVQNAANEFIRAGIEKLCPTQEDPDGNR
jgi:hypothetical protein